MGHATHFLRRLDRVSDSHVELALTLYRDEALLREVLSRSGLPDGVERLAVSLDDPLDGPFVILTRTGRFVTCLGKGMRVTDHEKHGKLVVLSRERLDAAAGKVERMRERFAEVAKLKAEGGEGVAARAFRRMQEDAFRFPREQAEVLLGVLPLVARDCAIALFDVQPALLRARQQVGYLRFDRLSSAEADLALAFGNAICSMGHLLVLTHHEDAYAATEILSKHRIACGGQDALDERVLPCALSFGVGTFAHALRAIWAMARRGKKGLPALKAMDMEGLSSVRFMRELGLAAMALASPKLRAEATKAMWRRPPGVHLDALSAGDCAAEAGASAARAVLDDLEGANEAYLMVG
ncbi:MAG: hypothetical protein H5U40_05600, partial [Polyangiaceae bacterium]|nr:hypothetical protein [Polyangiaceae bacterium]